MKEIGIKYFYTSSKPLGGIIKKVPEDFVVEEIDKHGKLWKVKYPFYSRILDLIPRRRKEYLHLTLVKRNLDTIRAVQLISKSLGISRKRIKFAGNKDKRAVTSQRISIFNVSIKEVRKVKVKGIKLKDFRYSSEEIKIGDLWGNRFTVRITDIPFEKEVIRERVEGFKREIANGVANFFGIQRFG
ncbi:tRNA pseudouridine(13) synthase TruD, partial [Nanoarchaeota archaeon]